VTGFPYVVNKVSSIDSAPKAQMLPESDYSRLALRLLEGFHVKQFIMVFALDLLVFRRHLGHTLRNRRLYYYSALGRDMEYLGLVRYYMKGV
jgi:hypothetical protein